MMESIQEESKQLGDPDALNFERRLWETLHELNLKRALLKDCERDLNNAVLVQHELERSLDHARCDAQETRLQLELALTTARRWEEERSSVMESASRQRVQLEVAAKERDALKDQTRAVQLENMKLKRTVEEQEGQLRCQLAFQESTISYQTKIREAMKEVNSQMQKLEQEQRHLEHTVQAVKALSSRLQLQAKFHDSIQEKGQQHRVALEKKLIALRAENGQKLLRPSIPTSHEGQGDTSLHNIELESLLTETRARLTTECEATSRLNQVLEGSQRAVNQALAQEAAVQQKLKEERSRIRELQMQLVSTQKELQDERNLHKKPQCIECEVQTDPVFEASMDQLKSSNTLSGFCSGELLNLPPPDQYKDSLKVMSNSMENTQIDSMEL